MRAYPVLRIAVWMAGVTGFLAGCGLHSAGVPISPEPVSSSLFPTTPFNALPDPPRTPTSAPSPRVTPPRAPTVTPIPTPPVAPFPQHTDYRLTLIVDYAHHRAAVEETITYPNHTGLLLADLLLVVPPNQEAGSFQLVEISRADGLPIALHNLNGTLLHVPLSPPLPPGEILQLHLIYQLALPQKGSPFGYTRRQLNLGDWYPFVPPRDPEVGWLVYQPSQVGEFLVYPLATFEVDLTLTDSDPDLVVAASSSAENQGQSYIFRPLTARNFAISISPDFQVASGMMGDVEVRSYFFPETRPAGLRVLEVSLEALEVYSATFAPYQHASLAAVEADFPDGMEYDALYFLGQKFYWSYTGDAFNNLSILAAHETAHQWWFGQVGNNQPMEPWLDEALATYSELVYYEKVFPDRVAWWWKYRVAYYQPEAGEVNDPVYKYGSFRPYVNAVYLRGVKCLEEIRETMGREAFLRALQAYARKNRGQIATADDFWEAIRLYWDGDLQPVRARYFSTDGIER